MFRIKDMTRVLCLVFMLVCCLSLAGCATLGQGASGLAQGISTLVMLPFKIVGASMGILSKMPLPPPGVF